MAIFSAAGTVFKVGTALAFKETDFVEADFNSVTWTTVGNIGTIGAFGDQPNFGEYVVLGTRRVNQFVTTLGGGTGSINVAFDELDAGQAAILAFDYNNYYPVQITLDNATTGTATQIEFLARWSSFTFDALTNNVAVTATANFAVSSNLVITDRTTA